MPTASRGKTLSLDIEGRKRARRQGDAQAAFNPPDLGDLSASQRNRLDRIIQTAYELLEQHEYADIQMRDVADHGQVALGTLYRYFSSKEHLFAAVLVVWGERLHRRVERSPLTGANVETRLLDVYTRVVDAFQRLPQFFRLMVTIEASSDPHARALYEEFSRTARGAMSAPLKDLDPQAGDDISDVLANVLSGVLRAWALNLQTVDQARAQIARAIHLIFAPPPKPVRAKSGASRRESKSA